ncbi:hypothetical protein OF376_00640 [Ureaplasma miroungigenitalium]|uniref:Uncharacterized protein n=1 Tax=Ureaplasma miroungigenitalium TaxID=1042321 RepID=A0ABT3BM32_9BACT|nr:hypothetical protein [Ureaplasma miroungigenitalium]MCV3728295.1 hypothetical protein [Ureaplasma miroungigenitalium]MCV3734100.1 hypothetical protein [Ureaplasma miroungigenitalium]
MNNENNTPVPTKTSLMHKLKDFIKTFKGFVVITFLGYVLVAICLGVLIYAVLELDTALKDYREWNYDYLMNTSETEQHDLLNIQSLLSLEIFKWGSVLGCMLFIIIILNINIFAYWSYSNHYIPELKDNKLLSNWLKAFISKQKANKTEPKKDKMRKTIIKKDGAQDGSTRKTTVRIKNKTKPSSK